MRKGLFTIVIPLIIVIGLIFSFGIINSKNSYNKFVEDGYVISSSDNKYKHGWSYWYIFSDIIDSDRIAKKKQSADKIIEI